MIANPIDNVLTDCDDIIHVLANTFDDVITDCDDINYEFANPFDDAITDCDDIDYELSNPFDDYMVTNMVALSPGRIIFLVWMRGLALDMVCAVAALEKLRTRVHAAFAGPLVV